MAIFHQFVFLCCSAG